MAKAMYVSLKETYPELNERGRERGAHGLHNATTCWWEINLESARGAKYVFGVYETKVVSAYEIVAGVDDWPVMRTHRKIANRKAIPVVELPEDRWNAACSWTHRFYGNSVGYGEVDDSGDFKQVHE